MADTAIEALQETVRRAASVRSPLRIAVALVTQRAVKATAVGSSPR